MELEKLIERSRRIVFFGGAGVSTASGIPDFRSADGLYSISAAGDGSKKADLMIVAGTSLSVEPAASLIEYFSGKDLVVINKEATPADEKASLVIRDDVAGVFEALAIKEKEKHQA